MEKEVIKFLDENRTRNWFDGNLPDPSAFPVPTVTLTKEQMTRFRNNYTAMMYVVADLLGVDVKKFCGMDVLGHYMRQEYKKYREEHGDAFPCEPCRGTGMVFKTKAD